ncbi:MAG: VWA domain-containing protein [Bauldia sp.]|nr:VWA domain-containing protein [Bauldia sp.]
MASPLKPGTTAPTARTEPGTPAAAPRSEVAEFLAEIRRLKPTAGARGRLIFSLDATMSRQPTWDSAMQLQAEMFDEAARVGTLDVQLVYYRGFQECRASKWVGNAAALRDLMTGIDVRAGRTQIGKLLAHARRETAKERVQAMVFIGDAFEETVDIVADRAGELGLLGVPMFVFQEGGDPAVERTFREIARLTKGAYARFDRSSARELASLLRAVATFAAGGRKALAASGGSEARLLLEQLR